MVNIYITYYALGRCSWVLFYVQAFIPSIYGVIVTNVVEKIQLIFYFSAR